MQRSCKGLKRSRNPFEVSDLIKFRRGRVPQMEARPKVIGLEENRMSQPLKLGKYSKSEDQSSGELVPRDLVGTH